MSITLVILVACVLASVSAFNNRDIFFKLDFQPYMIDQRKQWYRFISHAFIHADWGHLVINMFVLYQFGKFVEGAFAALFPDKWVLYFLMLYVGGILFSTIPGYARNRKNYAYHGVGASGAVSAIVYAFILIDPMAPLGIFLIPFHIPAWIFGLLYLALEYYLDKNSKSHIAHSAHYFGAVFGLVFTFILEPQLLLRFF
ncbi:MAG: rhomboid family intramembrane serine protease [Flavobacteriales bacterium]|nr:rhomboid family intramembrane serine protease [Flavobacteriales bacterium]